MADTHFRTSAEMFDAGYALPVFSIMRDSLSWKYREEEFRTFPSCPTVQNHEPNLRLARIEDVKANVIG